MTSLSLAGDPSHSKLCKSLIMVDIGIYPNQEGSDKIVEFMRSAVDGFASLEEAANYISDFLPHREKPKDLTGLNKNLRKKEDRFYWHWDPKFLQGRQDQDIKESVKMVADMPDMDLMDLIEEFEIIFKRKPMNMEELKQFYRENYEMESPVRMREKIKEKITMEAKDGGLMDLGGKEMDLRGGGFVPIGKKERADDVPARLSKNEFVMTADAVRAAGGGSVNKGAQRMYDVMNKLEARA